MFKKAAFSLAAASTAIALGLVSTARVGLAQSVQFTLANLSNDAMTEFYISPPHMDDWAQDLLTGRMLLSGKQVPVTINASANGCIYDVLMVFSDGSEIEEYDVNLCDHQNTTLTITDQ